jgi:hypothetical protein
MKIFDADVTGSLHVSGSSNLQGDVSVTGSLNVSGDNKFGDQLSDNHNFTGSVNISGSATIIGNFTASQLHGTASYAVTSSYSLDSDKLDGKDSSAFATTGSNVFKGDQTITGSLIVTGSNTFIGTQTVTGALYTSGSNELVGNTTLSGSITISGSFPPTSPSASLKIYGNTEQTGYVKFLPVVTTLDTSISGSYIFVSGSTDDLYFSQNSAGYANVTRLRWLEGNLYTGILKGGVLSSTPGSTTFNVSAGDGIIVTINASLTQDPYPTVKPVSWPAQTNVPIINSGSAKITYVGIDNTGGIVQQVTAWGSTNIDQWDQQINLGVVLHLSGSVSTGVFNSQQTSYAQPQKTDDFLRAFGPLKVSGHVLSPSGSAPTLSLKKTGGNAYKDGANYTVNPNHPSTVIEGDINTSKIYRYYISGSSPVIDTGVGNAGYTTIDNTHYVNTTTGTLSSVGNGWWSIQRVFWVPNSPTNAFIVYYGNSRYSTLLNAVNAKDSEPFTEAPNTALNAIFLGYIIIEGGNNRDLLNPAETTIIPGGLFRSVGGVGSSGTSAVATALSGLSDVELNSLSQGDLLMYNGGDWINTKRLPGNYTITGSLTTTQGFSGSLDYSYLINKPTLVSGSSQITYSGLTGIPSGIVSGSSQISSLGFITGYTETDTLDSVTDRNAVTTNTIEVGGLTSNGDIQFGPVPDNNVNYSIKSGGQIIIHSNNQGTADQYFSNLVLKAGDGSTQSIFNVGGSNASTPNQGLWYTFGGSEYFRINPSGTVKLNQYTTNGFVKFINSDGTLSVDTNTYLTAHPSVSAASSSNNSGRTYIQDILLDSFGHITGITTATETVTDTNNFTTGATFNTGNGEITFTKNDGTTYTVDLDGRYGSSSSDYYTTGATFNTGNGEITFTRNDGGTYTVDLDGRFLTAHPSVSAASSSDNSGRTYIQDILLDSFGHITGITTATETVVDTYTTGGTTNSTTGLITFTKNDGGTYTTSISGYVSTQIANLVASAPSTLDTLNELALALGSDPNFATTTATAIGNKVSKSGDTMTGNLTAPKFITSGGTSSQFVKGDGTLDSSTYLTSYSETDTLATVTARGASTAIPVTFNSNVTLGNSADLVFKDLAGTFPTSGKGFDWELNNDGARIYAIQPSSDSIDLVFQLRDNATTNDRFVFWVDDYQGPAFDKYPLIIRGGTEFDLVNSSLYIGGTLVISNGRVLQNVTGNISMFTNNAGYLTAHPSVSAASSSNNSGRTYIQDILLDSFGHITGITTATETVTDTNYYVTGATFNTGDGVITLTRNDGNTITVDIDGRFLTAHPSVSAASSSNNSGRTYIQDILLDSFGHITGITTATETVTDTNTFITGATFNTSDGVITITKNDGNTVTVDIDGRFLTSYSETDTLATVTARGNTTNQSITVSGVTSYNDVVISGGTLTVYESVSGATVFAVDGTNGRLFAVTDDLSNSLFSVNTISGLPVIEAFADYHVIMGRFNQNDFYLGTSGEIGMGTLPVSGYKLAVVGNIGATSFVKSGGTSTQFLKADGSVDSNTYLTAHPSVSAASSSNNSGRTYIQDILLDSFGHITGITTGSETVTDTNNYTTGVTFNTGDGVLTFTRNDGGTYTVDLDGRYGSSSSDFYTTGATFNSSNGIVTFTRNDGGTYTVDIDGKYLDSSSYTASDVLSKLLTVDGASSGLDADLLDGQHGSYYYPASNPSGYISSYVNYYVTGATFNTSNGVITMTRNDGGTVTVDIDGKYSELGHTHDDRYLPYSKTSDVNKASGWYTIAVNTGSRAVGKFILRDTSGGNHQSAVFYATHHYGNYSDITVLINSRYGGNPFRYIRIQDGGTYDGALLQVYIDDSSSQVQAWMLENIQASGWVIKDWIPDGTDPGDVTNFSALTTTPAQVDLDNAGQGGMIVTGPIYGGGDTTQYEYLNTNNYSTTTDTRYYTETEIANFFSGSSSISGYNKSNWDTAYGWGNHATQGYATTGYVQTQITNLIDGAPAALDTLNELAAALGDDPNFATTFAGAIGAKLPLSGGTMTGNIAFGATSNLGLTWGLNTDAAFIKFISTSNAAGASYLEIGTQDDSDEEIKFTQSGNVRFYLATDGFLRNGAGYKYVFENGTWAIDISGNAATVTNGVYTNGSYSNPAWITALAGSKITGNISGNAYNITQYTINQDLGTGNSVSFNAVTSPIYYTTASSTRNKIILWGTDTNYVIGMESAVVFGGLNDYAMTFQMNNEDDRGFWWGDATHSTSQGAMALTTNGYLTVARGVRVGYGESDTATPNVPLQVYGSGSLVFDVQGSQGQLFSVTDSLSGSLFSVNDISGLPVLEVFSDDRLVAGSYGTNAFVVSGTTTTVSGSLAVSGSATVNGGTVWHSNNDGSGSGLDADTLDGYHASSFLTSYSETDTLASVTARGASTSTAVTFTGGFNDGYITFNAAQINRSGGFVELQYGAGGGVRIFGNTAVPITFNTNGTAIFSSSITANSFVKSGGSSSQFLMADGSVSTNPGWLTAHPSVSASSSSNNSGRTYIQDIFLDSFGHITGITTATETVVDTDTNYYLTSASFNTGNGVLTLGVTGYGNVTVNLDGRYQAAGSYLTSESDTLNSVTTRGASTTNDITIGGLTVGGSLSYGSFTSSSNYVTGADNILLKGNSSGVSGIFFESEKNGTNINHPSDFGFIQYHAYGIGGSSGEANRLVIGVSNDGDDVIVMNPVNSNGLVVRVGAGTTEYTVYHAGNVPTWNQNTSGNAATATYATTAGALTSMNISQFTNNSGYLTAHPTISAASSVNNSGRTYIQDITLDSNGHITGIVSATETVTDTDTNYYVTGATFNTSTGVITMTRNDGGTVTVDIDGKYQEAGTYLGAISYNNDSNSTYQLLWGSGNAVYGTAGVYVNPSSDYVYAQSFNAGDWFRSSAQTGWYNSTYDGGIYMTESTSVRVYNNKGFWIDGGNGNSVNDATLYVTATNNNDWLAQFNAYNGSKTEYGIYVNIAAGATYGYALRTDSSSFTYRVDGSGRVYAPIYYDINDTNYYVNPASTSNLGIVKLNSTASGTEVFTVDGVNGRLFTITDDLSNSLFSVNTIAGVPVIEAFADNKVIMGRFNQNDLHISTTGEIGMGNTSVSGYKLAVTGNVRATSFVKTGGSSSQFLMADGSVSTNPGWITSYTDTNYYLTSASFNTGNGVLTLGVTGYGNVTVDLDGRYLESYSETDTLDSVLSRGASTTRTAEFYQTSNTFVNTVAAANRGLTVYQNTAGADAYMTFHISGDYAGYFGLGGAENDLVWGGWSVGNVRYRIWHSGNDGSGSGLDADTLDGYHASSFLTGHPSVSAAGSSNNSGRTYIQDILLDSFGHITGITTATETVVDTDTNYYTTSASFNTSNGIITFSRNDGGTYTVDIDGKYAESSHTHDDRYFTETESDARFQPLENQRVSTSSTVRFSNTYTTAWFRNDNSNTGMYNETTTMHWSSAANGYWDASSTNSTSGIRFYTGGHLSSIRGYLHSNSSNEIGFLNSGGNWSLRCDNSQNVHVTTAVYAPIYYDSANSNYYLNPNGYSNLGTVRFNSSGANAEVVAVDGVNGRLFTVTDDMTDSIFSVNTISGLPVIEAFANYKVVMGRYGQNDFIINENGQVSIGSTAQAAYKFTVIGGQWGSYFRGGDSGTGSDIARFVDNGGNTKLLVRGDGNSYFYGSVYINDNIIWHAGNDGSGSGLDADLLDGQHGSYFINTSNIGSQSVNYASSAGNADTVDSLHASDFVRAYTTSAGNIDSDWGQSFKTFDPIPTGTPPLASPNIRTINIGENFSRRTQLAFDYASDLAYFRRRNDSGWQTWREFIHSGNIGSFAWTSSNDGASSGLDADLLDGQHGSYYATASSLGSYLPLAGGTLTGDLLSTHPFYPGYNNGGVASQGSYYLYGNSTNSGLRTNGNFLVNNDIYWGNQSVWLSDWLNQNVKTNASPTFVDIYANNWFRNNQVNEGLYNEATNNHWYSENNASWTVGSTNASYGEIRMRLGHQGTYKGSFYWDAAGIGILNEIGGWGVRVNYGGSYGGTIYGSWNTTGHFLPTTNNAYDLGSASLGWRNIYTNDLHLSNMNKPEGNDIDGTSGTWTIQEGAENLYIINNLNGKKYRITLEEI